ncbi:inactive protein RESTRICTED TEV MOVEMENT 1-like isoform X1 [Diospyros lotus]|uniref:inactive protein RESTRICTED TEV MOVEMENT 1-like isoform X1 n=1 Tax=Diospyros lotus TaxID=55363 RepID=UPI0022581EF1|nr:inactive protein RESTRICTED TEV MOVEMENT 1-like isoform X1 [Diospyros lotus]
MIKLVTGGYSYGKAWDHKERTELVQIFISHDDYAIRSLQFLYSEYGKLVLSDPPDGSSIGNRFSTVTLQYPDEFLTSLKGTYCPENYGYRKLISIEFGTNLGRYGPFGQAYKGGEYFDFQMGNHRSFGGFYGTVRNGALESIGVYVKPISCLSNLNSDLQVNVRNLPVKPK